MLEPLLFNRGKNFLSLLFHEVCKLIDTKKMNTSKYHPQSDGLVEKFNSTLISMLPKSIRKYMAKIGTSTYIAYIYIVHLSRCCARVDQIKPNTF